MNRYVVIIWTSAGDEHHFAIEAADAAEATARARILAAGLDFELLGDDGRLLGWGPNGALFRAA